MEGAVYRIDDMPEPVDWYKPPLGKIQTKRDREKDMGRDYLQMQWGVETKVTYINASPRKLYVQGISGVPMRLLDRPNCRTNELLIMIEVGYEHNSQFDVNRLTRDSKEWCEDYLHLVNEQLGMSQPDNNLVSGYYRQQPGKLVFTYALDLNLLKEHPRGIYLSKFNLFVHEDDGVERELLPYEGFLKPESVAPTIERSDGMRCYFNSHDDTHDSVWINMGIRQVRVANNILDVNAKEGFYVEVDGEDQWFSLTEMKSNGYYFSKRAAIDALNLTNADKTHLNKDPNKLEEFNNVTTAIGGLSKVKPVIDLAIQLVKMVVGWFGRAKDAGSSTA